MRERPEELTAGRWRSRRCSDIRLAVAGAAATALVVWAADARLVDSADRGVFRWINSRSDVLCRPLWVVQLAGVLGAPLIVAAAAVLAHRFRLAVGLVLLVPAKLGVEYGILKVLVHRERPGAAIAGAVLRDGPAAGTAFPSGHAIVLFGMATLLSPYLGRRWREVAFGGATVAAVARVYLGAHTPLDVLAGAAAGVGVGAVLALLVGLRIGGRGGRGSSGSRSSVEFPWRPPPGH
ncbi:MULTISPECIES: phosphatase PAP2 family protein [Nocardia]|uniref:phosphatase PAP2 family protein n=1 Tax=Nocardia TaxID=1817 RepID=UPI0024559D90|nr:MULTISPECIES: phosphatase PAP2 family protein [Nocardia]